MIQGMVNAGKMQHLGVEPNDPAELAVDLQATALHDQWEEMLQKFKKDRPDCTVAHFDEAYALSRLRDDIGSSEFDHSFLCQHLMAVRSRVNESKVEEPV